MPRGGALSPGSVIGRGEHHAPHSSLQNVVARPRPRKVVTGCPTLPPDPSGPVCACVRVGVRVCVWVCVCVAHPASTSTSTSCLWHIPSPGPPLPYRKHTPGHHHRQGMYSGSVEPAVESVPAVGLRVEFSPFGGVQGQEASPLERERGWQLPMPANGGGRGKRDGGAAGGVEAGE